LPPPQDAQSFSVKRAQVEFHNFASLGEPERAIAGYLDENVRRASVIRAHRDFIGPMSPFLEIGANAGHTSYMLANQYGGEGFALDISADALRHGIALMDRWKLSRAPVRVAGDAVNLPFRDNSIQFVMACQMLSQFMNIESVFLEVKRVLAPGGVFALDVSVPNAHEHARDPNRAYFCPRFRYPATGEMVRYTERFDYDQARQILFVTMEFMPEPRPKESWVTPLAHRQFYPQELEALLHYNGFAIEQAWGDYKGGKLDRYSEIMAIEAPNSVETVDGDSFVWLDNRFACLTVRSDCDRQATLSIFELRPGPSRPAELRRTLVMDVNGRRIELEASKKMEIPIALALLRLAVHQDVRSGETEEILPVLRVVPQKVRDLLRHVRRC